MITSINVNDSAGTETHEETEHYWIAYGRLFKGYGSSMDPHHCGDVDEPCFTRTRTVTVITGEWSEKEWI